MIWSSFLSTLPISLSQIHEISFRNKRKGWNQYRFYLSGENFVIDQATKDNLYMKGFKSDLFVRPSCTKCPARAGSSGSCLTMGDFWGIDVIDSSFNDDKGLSLILVHNKNECNFLKQLNLNFRCYSDFDALRLNPSYYISAVSHVNRSLFFYLHSQNLSLDKCIEKSLNLTLYNKGIILVKRVMRKIKKIIKAK